MYSTSGRDHHNAMTLTNGTANNYKGSGTHGSHMNTNGSAGGKGAVNGGVGGKGGSTSAATGIRNSAAMAVDGSTNLTPGAAAASNHSEHLDSNGSVVGKSPLPMNGSVLPAKDEAGGLDSSKDESLHIDVESMTEDEKDSALSRTPLNNVTNMSSNNSGASQPPPSASAATAGPPPPPLLHSQQPKKEEEVDWSDFFLGDMPLSTWLQAVRKYVLAPLIRHPRSMAFRKPVDPIALGIPIYSQIITRPMDLGTVRTKVEKNLYNSKAGVLNDIDLVWNNARKFNPMGHEVHDAAVFLQTHTREHCLKAMKANQGALNSGGGGGTPLGGKKPPHSTPLPTPVRQVGIREARKKAPLGLPGEYDDLKPQHLEQKYVSKLSDPLKACDNILRSLMLQSQHWDYVEPFMKASKAGLMSLGLIHDRMRSYHYTSSKEFANDMRRIVTETYRQAEDPEEDFKSQKAAKLQKEFERMYATLVNNDCEGSLEETYKSLANSDPFIKKLLSAQTLVAHINSGMNSLVEDYDELKALIKAKKAAKREARNRQVMREKAAAAAAAMNGRSAMSAPRKRPNSDSSPVKRQQPAPKKARPTHSPQKAVQRPMMGQHPQQPPPMAHQQQQQQRMPVQQQQSAVNAVSNRPSPEQIGEWISMLDDSKQENLLEILRSNGENIEVDSDGSVELSLESWSQKTLDEVELFLRREIPSEKSSKSHKNHRDSDQSSNSSDSSSSDDDSSSESDSSDED